MPHNIDSNGTKIVS